MKQALIELPSLAFVVGTRAALAAGAGLLVTADYPPERRRRIGGVLVAVGALTTIPALLAVIRAVRRSAAQDPARARSLVGATRFPRKADDDRLPPLWDAADVDDFEEMEAAARE